VSDIECGLDNSQRNFAHSFSARFPLVLWARDVTVACPYTNSALQFEEQSGILRGGYMYNYV